MPLFGLTPDGQLYEESSIRDDGKGINRLPSFADEGSVVFGALDSKQVKNRKIHQQRMKIAQAKKRAMMKKAIAKKKLLEKKKFQQKQVAVIRAKKSKILSEKKKAAIYNKARKQRNFGYEYNDLMGDIFEGFENEGQVVGSDFSYNGYDFDHAESYGSSTIFNGNDEGLGWSLKKAVKSVSKAVSKAAPKITMPKNAAAAIKDVGKITAKVVTAPVALSHNAMKSIPLIKDVYKGVDKLTGGTLTSIYRVNNLANKLAEGKPISKGEIMEAAMMALKVGAIVASGGSAASLVSAGAGMLKGGPLGKSALGQNLLTLAEVGGAATALYQASASKAAEQAAKAGSKELVKQAAKEGSKEVAQQTLKQSVQKAVEGKAMDMAKQKALAEVQKKTGIPVSLISALHDVKSAEGSIAEKTKMFATKIGEEKLKKAGLGDAATQAVLSGNAQALGVMIKDAPNLAISQAQRQAMAAKVKIIEQASIEKLKSKLEQKLGKAKTQALNIESLKDKIDKEINENVKKQMNLQLANLLRDNQKTQDEVIKAGAEVQVESMKAGVKVAAAEEGRFVPDDGKHPILKIHEKIKGSV